MSASESEEEYEVEAIRDYRSEDSDGNDCREYLVKWKGYESDDCTWEPKGQLTDPLVKEKIHKFKKIRQLEKNSTNYDRKENRYQDSYRQRSHEETNEERRERKASAKRKLEKLSEDRRRKKQKDEHKAIRPSKGNNAYASGSKSKSTPFKVSSDNVSARDKIGAKSRSIQRSRPQKSEKAKPNRYCFTLTSKYLTQYLTHSVIMPLLILYTRLIIV